MRNPKALHLLFALGRRGNAKPLNEVADDFLRCAELHPVFYCPPKVTSLLHTALELEIYMMLLAH